MKVYSYDIETYPDALIVVVKPYKEDKRFIFEISDYKNDRQKLKNFIDSEKAVWVGYNSKEFDDHMMYHIYTTNTSALEYKTEANNIIQNGKRYKPWEIDKILRVRLDMMEILNMGITGAKTTSLKQWKFNLRKPVIADLPYDHRKNLATRIKVDEVIEYCIDDVDTTEQILILNSEQITIRKDFGKLTSINLLPLSEVSLAKTVITKLFSKKIGIDEFTFKSLRTYHNQIKGSDIIVSEKKIFNDSLNKNLYEYYHNINLFPTIKSKVNPRLKKFSLKKVLNYEIEYPNTLKCVYGSGGIHGVVQPGIYVEDDTHDIIDFDFTSYYPHLIWLYNIEPNHLPKGMLGDQLKEWFIERSTKYPKKTHFTLNYSLKIILNLCYGQMGSEYSPLFDQKSQLSVCVNGMLYITKLIELAFEQGGDVLYANTDGIGVRIEKNKSKVLIDTLNNFADNIGIPLEYGNIKKWILLDVNNYIVIDQKDNVKEKGLFETYDTITTNKMYWKDTSSNIIPIALRNYFINSIPVEETILTHNDIYDFCIGVKGSNSFEFLLSNYDVETKTIRHKIIQHQRIVRYYISNDGFTLSKVWKENTKKGLAFDNVEATAPITLVNKVRVNKIYDTYKDNTIKVTSVKRYPGINFDFYIDKCKKIVDTIENNTTLI